MKFFLLSLLVVNIFSGCTQNQTNEPETIKTNQKSTNKESLSIKNTDPIVKFKLNDYLSENHELDIAVDSSYSRLSDHQKVAQLIMPAMGKHGQKKELIDELVAQELIGGILMLNGTKKQFKSWIDQYNKQNKELGALPFLYSADAEPSLVNRKIINTPTVPKANTLKNKKEVVSVAETISNSLNEIGINFNFAPVVDMSPNKTVGWRSFGHEPDSVIPWSNAFIETSQNHQIIATAKHFPGHGYVEGDTHKKLVYIDGELQELENYPPLIRAGVLSIMVGHIAVKNNTKYNTDDLPATISKNIVSNLLRDELGFKGLIVTDALNMGGVSYIEDADIKSIKAGCDIALMPLNAKETHRKLLQAYQNNKTDRALIETAVKRVIRMKLCLQGD